MMRCHACGRGETKPGDTDVVIREDGAIVIVRDVPAQICEDCDGYLLAEDVALKVSCLVDHAVEDGTDVSILRYAT